MRILVTGITSIHGWPIWQEFAKTFPADRLFGIRPPKTRGPEGLNIRPLCITDKKGLETVRDKFRPTHVVHCSGVCDLDVCEERPQWAQLLNTDGTKTIAAVFGADAAIYYFSTDLVFSGENPPGGGYTEESVVDPVSVAGRTFAAAEEELCGCERRCVVRLGLPIGPSIAGDKGAVDWIAGRLRRERPVTLFSDEWRSVIGCADIAAVALFLIMRQATGLYHCGGPRGVTLHGVGEHVVRAGGYRPDLLRGILRREEKNGPPRIGNVALSSAKLAALMKSERPDLYERLTNDKWCPCS